MTPTPNLKDCENFVSLQTITIDDNRNEASTSNTINNGVDNGVTDSGSYSIINLGSQSQSLNNISPPQNNEQNQHGKLYRFFFRKFNNKNKSNAAKYAKLEGNTQPSENIQASANLYEEEVPEAAASSSSRTFVNKLNNNLHNNVNRLLNSNNAKQKQQKTTVINFNTHDGVFSNLNEKPEVRSTRLPTYFEVTGNPANELDDPDIEVGIGQDIDDFGELLVNGLQVGSWYSYWGTILVSAVFEFIGFIFTFFLTSSHSAKDGSITGLGIILFKYAICYSMTYDMWFIVFLVILGIILCIKGFKSYRKIKRIENLVNSDPERYLELSFLI